MRIVPEGAILVAEARVRPSDRERLSGGMAGQIRLPGVERHGETAVPGAVSGISADRVAAETGGEEGAYYLLTMRLEETGLSRTLVPGMPVTVVVPTRARSVVDYILSPIRDAIANSMREV
jgi:multidrug efflux pump subunit AcrA (membrane-fusion protein)